MTGVNLASLSFCIFYNIKKNATHASSDRKENGFFCLESSL